jgi:hypothetical protein
MNLAVKVVRQRISQPATSPGTPLDSQRSSENLDPRRHPDAQTTRTGGQDLPRRRQIENEKGSKGRTGAGPGVGAEDDASIVADPDDGGPHPVLPGGRGLAGGGGRTGGHGGAGEISQRRRPKP